MTGLPTGVGALMILVGFGRGRLYTEVPKASKRTA